MLKGDSGAGPCPARMHFRSIVSFVARFFGAILRHLTDNRPLPVAILFPLQSIVDRGERHVRLAKLGRLAHQRFELAARLIESASGERRVEEFPPFAAYAAEIEHFARAVRAKDPALLYPAEDGVANAKAMEAALHSMHAARP